MPPAIFASSWIFCGRGSGVEGSGFDLRGNGDALSCHGQGTGKLGRHLPPQVKQGMPHRLPEAKARPWTEPRLRQPPRDREAYWKLTRNRMLIVLGVGPEPENGP